MTTEIRVTIANRIYAGWEEVYISKSLDHLAHKFTLKLTKRFDDLLKNLLVTQENALQIFFNNDLVLTGYIDHLTVNYDKNSHQYILTGRSKTADLIDCTALYKSGEFLNKNFLYICTELCKPFNIKVINFVNPTKNFLRFRLADKTVFECLQFGARLNGVLLLTNADGNLLLTQPEKTINSLFYLKTGVNIKTCNIHLNYSERFSQLTVKGQNPLAETISIEKSFQAESIYNNPQIKRYRPKVIITETGYNDQLKIAAEFILNSKTGLNTKIIYTVYNWYQQQFLWKINTLVKVNDEINQINDFMLITHVEFIQSITTGTITKITVVPTNSFTYSA